MLITRMSTPRETRQAGHAIARLGARCRHRLVDVQRSTLRPQPKSVRGITLASFSGCTGARFAGPTVSAQVAPRVWEPGELLALAWQTALAVAPPPPAPRPSA